MWPMLPLSALTVRSKRLALPSIRAGPSRSLDTIHGRQSRNIGENMSFRRSAKLSVDNGTLSPPTCTTRLPTISASSAFSWPSELDRRQADAASAQSAARSPCMWLPPIRWRLKAERSSTRPWSPNANARCVHRAGARESGKPDSHHRKDGRRPPAQVLRGSLPREAGLRHQP